MYFFIITSRETHTLSRTSHVEHVLEGPKVCCGAVEVLNLSHPGHPSAAGRQFTLIWAILQSFLYMHIQFHQNTQKVIP